MALLKKDTKALCLAFLGFMAMAALSSCRVTRRKSSYIPRHKNICIYFLGFTFFAVIYPYIFLWALSNALHYTIFSGVLQHEAMRQPYMFRRMCFQSRVQTLWCTLHPCQSANQILCYVLLPRTRQFHADISVVDVMCILFRDENTWDEIMFYEAFVMFLYPSFSYIMYSILNKILITVEDSGHHNIWCVACDKKQNFQLHTSLPWRLSLSQLQLLQCNYIIN